jgi:hypothetical protein
LAANHYHVVCQWRVLGSLDEIYVILSHPEDLPRWWPAMFLESLPILSGDEEGFAKVTRLESRGWLPYVHRWHTSIEEADQPAMLTFRAWGDFKGQMKWRLEQHDAWADVTLDWDVEARKPVERYLSGLLNPVFAVSLRWALARGEESLRLELARRHMDEAQRSVLSPPPGPVRFPKPAIVAVAGLLFGLVALRRRL